jgi:hypothetical protein
MALKNIYYIFSAQIAAICVKIAIFFSIFCEKILNHNIGPIFVGRKQQWLTLKESIYIHTYIPTYIHTYTDMCIPLKMQTSAVTFDKRCYQNMRGWNFSWDKWPQTGTNGQSAFLFERGRGQKPHGGVFSVIGVSRLPSSTFRMPTVQIGNWGRQSSLLPNTCEAVWSDRKKWSFEDGNCELW